MRKTGQLRVTLLVGALICAGSTAAQQPSLRFPALLHAHNCYPEDGQWTDRLDRALKTGLTPIAIEQDVAWSTANGGQSVVAHETTLTGKEPSLEEYFFRRVTPIMDAVLRDARRETWPAMILHLDFKTNEPEHHRAIWELLGRYERFLTTAVRERNDQIVQPLQVGPLLVLTENGAGQTQIFNDAVPVGGRLRLFGTVPSGLPQIDDAAARAEASITASPSTLIPTGATNYRRWTNFSWLVVERGGQASAGDWTQTDAARLTSIVDRAHSMGLWVRFYTLNGHRPEDNRGWTASYNFGSLDAVKPRWRAAIAAGVELIATDQYEDFAQERRRGGN